MCFLFYGRFLNNPNFKGVEFDTNRKQARQIMEFFLRIKHWQLFLIWILSSTLFAATINTPIWILTFSIYYFVLIGWIHSIGKVSNKLNGKYRIENYKEDLWFILSLISVLPFGYFIHIRWRAFPTSEKLINFSS